MSDGKIKKDTQNRKWVIDIDNPLDHGMPRHVIKNKLESLAGLIYYCISDEIGGKTQCPHVHIFVIYQNAKKFSTMKNKLPPAHIEEPLGSNQQCRDYVFKQGKWENSEKGMTNLRDTHEEYGVLPIDRTGERNDLGQLVEMIKDGKSTLEIIDTNPRYIKDFDLIEKYRETYVMEKFKDEWRDIHKTYIYGSTGTGKSRYVMEKYGYRNVYRVTNYLHPFDSYAGQDVILFEEFHSSIKITDMLTYLDGYPVKLSSRYFDKSACFTKVYFATNIDIREQYPNIQNEDAETWNAFLRRIDDVMVVESEGSVTFPLKTYLDDAWYHLDAEQKDPFNL